MLERHESDDEESKTQDLSISKNIPKLDTAEILRRQGPEFEPPKEDITEKERYVGQGPSQTTVGPSTDPAGQANDQADQQKKDAEIEQLRQKDEALKSQELPKLREQLQQIQQEKEQEAQQSNSETDQNEDYYQGMGQ